MTRCACQGMVLLVAWLVAGVIAEAGEETSSIVINLKNEVYLAHAKYMLGEIAHINVQDDKLRNQLQTLPVGRAPRVGYVEKVRRIDLQARIERSMPGMRGNIIWKGPAVSKVRTLGVSYDKRRIVEMAEQRLRGWLADRYDNFTVRMTGNIVDLYLPQGYIKVEPVIKDGIQLNKRMAVWVDIFVDDEHYQSLPVWFGVSVQAPVYVIAKDAKKGEKLTDSFISKDIMDVSTVQGDPVWLLDLQSKRLHRDVNSGEVLTMQMIEDIPDVQKGRQVVVKASAGNVVVNSIAVAMDDGIPGERIRVRKPDAEIEYNVTVIGKNLVSADKE